MNGFKEAETPTVASTFPVIPDHVVSQQRHSLRENLVPALSAFLLHREYYLFKVW